MRNKKPSEADKAGPVPPHKDAIARVPPAPGSVVILRKGGGFPPERVLTRSTLELEAMVGSKRQKGTWSVEPASGSLVSLALADDGEGARVRLLAPTSSLTVVFTPAKGARATCKLTVEELKITGGRAAYLAKATKLTASAGNLPGRFAWSVTKGSEALELPGGLDGNELTLRGKQKAPDVRVRCSFTPDTPTVPRPAALTRKLAVLDKPVPRICVKKDAGWLDPPRRITAGSEVKLWAVVDKLENEPTDGQSIAWTVSWPDKDKLPPSGDRTLLFEMRADPADGAAVSFLATPAVSGEVRVMARLMKGEQLLAVSDPCPMQVGDEWRTWAQEQIEARLKSFMTGALATVRRLILETVNTLELGETEVPYSFQADWLEFLNPTKVQDTIKQKVKGIYDGVYAEVLDVTKQVKERFSGVLVKIKVPFLSSVLDELKRDADKAALIAEGYVKQAENAIEQLDLTSLAPPAFVELLAAARRLSGGMKLDFHLSKLTVGDKGYIALRADAALWGKLAVSAEPFATLDGKLLFLFRDLGEVAEAIFVKVMIALKLIEDGAYNAALEGFISEEMRTRLQEILDGRVRLEVKGKAGTFSPQQLLDVLKVKAEVESSLVFDFENGHASLDVGAAAKADITVDGSQLSLALDGSGSLSVERPFDTLWTNPSQGFGELVKEFVAALDVKAMVSVKAAGTGKFNRGLIGLSGDAKLLVEFHDNQVSFSFGADAGAEIDYTLGAKLHHLKLTLDADAGAKLTITGQGIPSFTDFWADRANQFPILLDKLADSLDDIHARVKVTAKDAGAIGLFQVTPSAGLTLVFDNADVALAVAADCAVAARIDNHELKLALTAGADAKFSIAGSPRLSELWRDPPGKFKLVLEKLVETLEVNAKVAVKASDTFTTGLARLAGGAAFTIAYHDHQATFDFSAAGAARVTLPDQPRLDLKLGATAGAKFPVDTTMFEPLWKDPQGELSVLLPKLGTAFEKQVRRGHVNLGVKVQAQAGGKAFAMGLIRLEGAGAAGRFSVDFRGDRASFHFDAGCKSKFTVLGQKVILELDADAGLTLDTSRLNFAALWDNPRDTLQSLFNDFPSLIVGEAYVDVSGDASLPIKLSLNPRGEVATLHVGAGVRVGFTSTDAHLKFGADTRFVMERFPLFELALELDGDVTVPNRQLAKLWRSPGQELSDLLIAFTDHFVGHLRVAFLANGMLDDKFPMPAVQEKLKELSLENVMGSFKIVVNFWSKSASERYVIVKFEGEAGVMVTLAGGITATLKTSGVTKVDGRTLRSFVDSPEAALQAIGDQAVQALASSIVASVEWFGFSVGTIEGSFESILAAHKFYTEGSWRDFLAYLWNHPLSLPSVLKEAVDFWGLGEYTSALAKIATLAWEKVTE
jgi:hypothetical protein